LADFLDLVFIASSFVNWQKTKTLLSIFAMPISVINPGFEKAHFFQKGYKVKFGPKHVGEKASAQKVLK
jgi:hypothetical protein